MLHEKRRLALTLYHGFVLAIIVGCASHMNSDVNASLRPLPSRPPARPSPLMRAEQTPTPANTGTGTLPSTLLTQASPAQGPGEVPILGRQPAALPPPAAGFPERLPRSPLMAPELPVMQLDQLIQIALDNQPRLRSAQAALEGADARLGIAKSGYFPLITTGMIYARETTNVSSGVNPNTGAIRPRSVSDTSVNRQDFTARFSQNVFDSFRREWNVQAARDDQNAAQFDLSTTRQDAVLNVQTAYYNYLLARRLVDVNEGAVRRNIQLLERARGFYEVGTRPKIDVTRAQVDLANAELALVRARNACRRQLRSAQ